MTAGGVKIVFFHEKRKEVHPNSLENSAYTCHFPKAFSVRQLRASSVNVGINSTVKNLVIGSGSYPNQDLAISITCSKFL